MPSTLNPSGSNDNCFFVTAAYLPGLENVNRLPLPVVAKTMKGGGIDPAGDSRYVGGQRRDGAQKGSKVEGSLLLVEALLLLLKEASFSNKEIRRAFEYVYTESRLEYAKHLSPGYC